MAQVLVMYKTPRDAAAFDKHYAEKHAHLAKKLPSLRNFETSKGPVATPAGPSSYHLVAMLQFDDMAAVQTAFTSAEGQAALTDAQIPATGGVDIFLFDSKAA